MINTDNITIVPGDQLALIPFGTLISDSSSYSKGNYQMLPYWFKSHNIAYANSATLLAASLKNQQHKSKEKSILAFAPSFEITPESTLYRQDTVRSSL